MTSYFTEVTINLIYKLFNVNMEDLNNKFNELNKTENGMILNRNITSTIDINTIIAQSKDSSAKTNVDLINRAFASCGGEIPFSQLVVIAATPGSSLGRL